MMRRHGYVILGAIVLLVGATGAAAATPGDGPPGDLPSPVPDFVGDLLGSIGDFVGGLVGDVFGFVDGLTPGAADDGLDAARNAASR